MFQTLAAFIGTPIGSGIFLGLITVWPLWRIFRRAGLNPLWSLLVFFPLLGLAAALGALCVQKWPVVKPGGVPHPQGAARSIREQLERPDSAARITPAGE
jgi:hypothetical protein